MKHQRLIENYINGNIKTARNQAKRVDGATIASVLVMDYGWTETRARLTAQFLKTGEGWQAACDAK